MAEYLVPDPADPAYEFMIGNPPEIIGAAHDPRLLVAYLHPPEHLAARVGHHLQTQRPDLLQYVDYLCGHPLGAAAVPQVRYTNEHAEDESERGTDLNRAFNPPNGPRTYEEKRAAEWAGPMREYAGVLDLHTSTTTCGSFGRFFIVARPEEPAVRDMIAASTIERVVVMPPHITEPSLIGQVPRSVSIEYSQELARTPEAVEEILLILDGLVRGRSLAEPRDREFYYVTRPIPRAEDPGLDTPNFELCPDGYYPVLLGENSYRKDPTKPYVGFAATRREIVEL